MNARNNSQTLQTLALEQVRSGSLVAIGGGPLVEAFIEALASEGIAVAGVVAAAPSTAQWLGTLGLQVLDANDAGAPDLFITQPREFTRHLTHVYAPGPALTAERVLASAARQYVCMAAASHQVAVLGGAAVPVEVVPMAQGYVARALAALGATPEWQQKAVTATGNPLLLVRNLDLTDPYKIEQRLNNIAGVVGHGLMARRPADMILMHDGTEVRALRSNDN